ncbi:MAG: carboxypeptidase regulatory-like domain-containing protein [Burkholderiales bacterium]|nr:carboxypeptidase regulatory-like domain-containing protein [Burkholderiales bacterium]
MPASITSDRPAHTPPSSAVRFAAPLAATAIALALAACGGGGSGSADTTPTASAAPTPTTPAAPIAVEIKGVAATGAPMAGATVTVYDATGAKVCESTAAADGSYACSLGTEPKAPFVIQAALGEVTLLSALGTASAGTVNVTPITHLIAATLAADGDPQTLMTRLASGEKPYTAEALQSAVDRVTSALKPLTDLLGATIDPIRGSFAADGTGYDKVLDALQVSIRPDGNTSNVEVTVKAMPTSEDAAPVAISFQANATTIPPLPATIDLGTVSTVNVPSAIADLAARLNACYALPAAQRVSDGTNAGSTLVAPACRTLFSQDDPTTFLSNGARVGPAQTAAYSSLFRDGAVGLRWEAGAFDFYRANGDWIVSYKVVLPDGTVSPEQAAARLEGGKLKMIGNQYVYSAGVRPIVQRREHINTPAASNLSVGYNVQIANRVDGSGNPVFSKVEVTTPRGNKLTYLPSTGLSYMVLAKQDGSASATPVIRLAGKMLDPARTVHPADVDTALFFADRTVYTEEVIRAIPDQSVWKMEFFHVNPATPNVVQAYRTVSRSMTLAEASQVKFAQPLAAMKDALKLESGATGSVSFTDTPSAGNPAYAYIEPDGGGAFWTVPAGAPAPTSVTIFGRAPSNGARFNDSVSVPPSARKATIRCSAQTAGDAHCAAAPYRDQYAVGSSANLLELWARDGRQMEYSSMTALYKLTVPTP